MTHVCFRKLGNKMAENTQHKISSIRPPRVQITYDVVVGNATEHKELPFVVGIMADLSGMRAEEPPALKDRSFVGIYADNMDDIMGYIKPNLNLSVENCLLNNKGKFKANLTFTRMDDFEPLNLIKQIPTLTTLYESRVNLKDMLSKMDGNDELLEMLTEIMEDPKLQQQLWREIEIDGDPSVDAQSSFETEEITEEALQTLNELPPIEENADNQDVVFVSPYEEEPLKNEPVAPVLTAKDERPKKEKKDNDDFF
jgi:type VI secretion system protein ImpB